MRPAIMMHCAIATVLSALSPALAQTITGTTTLRLDTATSTVIATCETNLDAKLQPYYGAQVECVVTDQTEEVVAAAHQEDDGMQGHAKATLSLPAIRGTIYFAIGKHRVVYKTQVTAAQDSPYLDFYNLQSVSEHWLPEYNVQSADLRFLGPGPPKLSSQLTLTVARTHDEFSLPMQIGDPSAPFQHQTGRVIAGDPGARSYGCPSGEERENSSGDVVLTATQAHRDCGGLVCAGLKKNGESLEIARFIRTSESSDAPTPCVEAAYKTLSASPLEERIPLLLSLLGIKMPLTEYEKLCQKDGACVNVGGVRSELNRYPAAVALHTIGAPATQPVLEYIATAPYQNRKAWEISVTLYELLGMSQAKKLPEIVESLASRRRDVVADPAATQRLDEAIGIIVQKYCRVPGSGLTCTGSSPKQ